jgi:hypothetical protein
VDAPSAFQALDLKSCNIVWEEAGASDIGFCRPALEALNRVQLLRLVNGWEIDKEGKDWVADEFAAHEEGESQEEVEAADGRQRGALAEATEMMMDLMLPQDF